MPIQPFNGRAQSKSLKHPISPPSQCVGTVGWRCVTPSVVVKNIKRERLHPLTSSNLVALTLVCDARVHPLFSFYLGAPVSQSRFIHHLHANSTERAAIAAGRLALIGVFTNPVPVLR
jgi:hypothetical protein